MPTNDLELYSAFFMNDKEYYLKQLEKYQSGKRLNFNFSVIALGISWFIYRKLYKESIVIFLIIAGLTALNFLLIKPYLGKEGNVLFFLIFALTFWAVLGFIANKIYIKKAELTVAAAKLNFQDDTEIRSEVIKKGGVNALGLLLVFVIIFIVVWLSSK